MTPEQRNAAAQLAACLVAALDALQPAVDIVYSDGFYLATTLELREAVTAALDKTNEAVALLAAERKAVANG